MVSRPYTPADYPTICRWFGDLPVPPAELLSPIGLVIPGRGYAGLYLTGTPFALVEPITVAPGIAGRAAHGVISALVRDTMAMAKESGITMLAGFTSGSGLAKIATRYGFVDLGTRRMMVWAGG